MVQISLTLSAERDLIDIYLFGSAQFGVAQANRYAAEISGKIDILASNPSFGANYSFVQDGLRRGEYGAHAIYYRATEVGILVLRILHRRMDAGRHLG